jgi:uncharacterized protein (TIGR03905 family)
MSVYVTSGVCSRSISFDIEDGILKDVQFQGGCSGNVQAISQLVRGLPVADVIKRLKGIDCDGRGTSCPDQLAKALEEALKKSELAG